MSLACPSSSQAINLSAPSSRSFQFPSPSSARMSAGIASSHRPSASSAENLNFSGSDALAVAGALTLADEAAAGAGFFAAGAATTGGLRACKII